MTVVECPGKVACCKSQGWEDLLISCAFVVTYVITYMQWYWCVVVVMYSRCGVKVVKDVVIVMWMWCTSVHAVVVRNGHVATK